MIEKWKPVPGYEGIYEASNTGKIKTSEGKTTYSDFHGVRVWSSRELKGRGDNPQTGKRVGLWKNKKGVDNGHRSFNSFAECSRFLGRKPGYVSNTLKKKKKTLQHVNGTLYEVIK